MTSTTLPLRRALIPTLAALALTAAAHVHAADPTPANPAPADPAKAVLAEPPKATPAEPATATSSDTRSPAALKPMAWLEGCWQGSVNHRDFREVWLPLRGDVMVGVSQTVTTGRTLDYEYLRLELRGDALHYVTAQPGRPESAFKLAGRTTDLQDEVFRFENPDATFPRSITYRHATLGWLYAEVEGKVNGSDRKVIYPMRHVNCETGANLEK